MYHTHLTSFSVLVDINGPQVSHQGRYGAHDVHLRNHFSCRAGFMLHCGVHLYYVPGSEKRDILRCACFSCISYGTSKQEGCLQRRRYKCSYGRPKQSPDLEGSILTKGSFLPEEVLVEQSAKLSFHKIFWAIIIMLCCCNAIALYK